MKIYNSFRLKHITLLIALITSLTLQVKAEVKWIEKEYNFGLFREVDGPKTGSVRLVNTGQEELLICGARPSCGCTSVRHTIDPIMPGDTATISFTYDPTGRPGEFSKHIRVYLSDPNQPMATIQIRGNVLGTPQSLSTLYPLEVGPLRLSTDAIFAGELPASTTRVLFLTLYNQSLNIIKPSFSSPSKAISLQSTKEELPPGETLTLAITISTRQIPNPGEHTIPLEISFLNPESPSPDTPQTISVPIHFLLLSPPK